MSKRHKARLIALQGIHQFDIGKMELNEIIKFEWVNKKRVPDEVLSFAANLICKTIENLKMIDSLISKNINQWDIDKISKVDKNILRFSVYSLLFQKEIPVAVIINEAIDIAKKFGGIKSTSFINGVLDGIKKNIST